MIQRLIRIFLFAGLLLAIVIGIVWGVRLLQQQHEAQQYAAVYREAELLLAGGQAVAALDLLKAKFDAQRVDTGLDNWPVLMTRAALSSRNYSYLERLVLDYPNLLLVEEELALWWARAQMHRGHWDTLAPLFQHWSAAQSEEPHRWDLLQADHLMLKGAVAEARELLLSWSGAGRDEANRQLRLAMTSGPEGSKILDALNAAHRALPRTADVHAVAAQLIEQAGNYSLAQREYVAAFLLEPENPLFGDFLGEFYRRVNELPLAIDTWRQTVENTEDPRAWWKVWFWERVTQPRGEALVPPSGEWWGQVPTRLAVTSPMNFLEADFLVDHFSAPAILANSEAYHWIWILELLKHGDEATALELIETMPLSSHAIAPNLRSVLQALLDWRLRGNWPRGIVFESGRFAHRFLRSFESYRPEHLPSQASDLTQLERFLLSEWAIPALFLSEGWMGAAYRLQSGPCEWAEIEGQAVLDWIPYAAVKMTATYAGFDAALQLTELYPDDVAVSGQAGELLIQLGRYDEGLARLELVAMDAGGAGYRATYLLALAASKLGRYEEAVQLIRGREDLAQAVSGLELLARCARAQDQADEALQLYQQLDSRSIEGLIYRFENAKLQSDFVLARELVQTLLLLEPNEVSYHKLLSELDAAVVRE